MLLLKLEKGTPFRDQFHKKMHSRAQSRPPSSAKGTWAKGIQHQPELCFVKIISCEAF